MWALRKIDALSVFFVFSIGIILLLYRYDLVELSEFELSNKTTIDFESNVVYNEEKRIIEVLNPVFNIYYSEDGGETFEKSNGRLSLDKIQNKENTNIPTSYNWKAPGFNLPEIKSVACFIKNKNSLEVSPTNYFTDVSSYQSELPIINLSIKHSDMFDEFKGIHILGVDSWQEAGFYKAWWEREANYTNRGMDSERPANFQLFHKGDLLIDQNIGLRIGGNASRGFSQKSLKLYARRQYGSTIIKGIQFENTHIDEFESLVLRSSGNDYNRTLFADLFMQKLANGSEVYTQKGRPIELFVNGNYWGVYNLRERISINNIAKYYDKKASKVTLLENGQYELKDGDKEQHDNLHMIIDRLEKEEMSSALMKIVKDEIDIKSLMDYIFFETYFANNDWPNNNTMMYKIKGEKWRWILNDLDYSLAYPGVSNVNSDMFEVLKASGSDLGIIFYGLLQDSNFKSEFKDCCKKNISKFLGERALTIFEDCKRNIQSAIPYHILRWRTIQSKNEWDIHCKNNLDFINNRTPVYLSQLEAL